VPSAALDDDDPAGDRQVVEYCSQRGEEVVEAIQVGLSTVRAVVDEVGGK
jgi:hypothetical protein